MNSASYLDLQRAAGLGANADEAQCQARVQRTRLVVAEGSLHVAAEVVARWRPVDGELLLSVVKLEPGAVAVPQQVFGGAWQIGVSFFRWCHVWFVLNFTRVGNSQSQCVKEAA